MTYLRRTCRSDASFGSFNRKRRPLLIIIYVAAMTAGAVNPALPTPYGFRNLSGATWKTARTTSMAAWGYSPKYDPGGDGPMVTVPYFWIINFAGDDFESNFSRRSEDLLTAETISSQDSADGDEVPDTGTVTICDRAPPLPAPLDLLVSEPKGIPSGFHTPCGRELAKFNGAGTNTGGVSWENVGMEVWTRGGPVPLRGWLSELPAEETAAATGEHEVLWANGGISRDSFAWAEVAEPGTLTIWDNVCTWSAQPDWQEGEPWVSPLSFYKFSGLSLAEINYAWTNTGGMPRGIAGFFAPLARLSGCMAERTNGATGYRRAPIPSTLLLLASALVGLLLMGRRRRKAP